MTILLYITRLYIYIYIYIRIYIYTCMYIYIRFNQFFQLWSLLPLPYQIIFQIASTILHFLLFFFFFFNVSKYTGILLTKISSDLYIFSLINLSSIFFYHSFVQLRIVYHIIFKLLSNFTLSLPIIEYILNI